MPSHLHLASAPTVLAESRPIRVVLADDHLMLRRGLRQLLDLEQDVDVVAEAGDLDTALRFVRGKRPQVLVLDLGMPDGSSIATIGRVRELAPETQIVVLTSDDNPMFAQRAFGEGALGFVTKNLADAELAQAILAASRGERYVSPPMAARLESLQRGRAGARLTPRELEVLHLIALGHTSVEIASKLDLSPRTIETHRAHICRKLGVSTRAELVRYALDRRLIGG
jgi:two-component system, NarL family, response regulator NreC